MNPIDLNALNLCSPYQISTDMRIDEFKKPNQEDPIVVLQERTNKIISFISFLSEKRDKKYL